MDRLCYNKITNNAGTFFKSVQVDTTSMTAKPGTTFKKASASQLCWSTWHSIQELQHATLALTKDYYERWDKARCFLIGHQDGGQSGATIKRSNNRSGVLQSGIKKIFISFILKIILLLSLVGSGSAQRWTAIGQGSSHLHPRFGNTIDQVIVTEGDTAKLPCIVHNLADRSVTWMRRRDLHILTAGPLTYSADDRFQVIHTSTTNEWTLVIKFTQPRDAGIYDCQVNTDPKLSRPVTLLLKDTNSDMHDPQHAGDSENGGKDKTAGANGGSSKVFVANNTAATRDGKLTVEIIGKRELYIEEGSPLILNCVVRAAHSPPSLVYWYHGNTLVDYNSPRGGVNLKVDHSKGETHASMSVFSVGPGDSGMYSCVPPLSHPATVHVHVQKGEHEAAIQQGGLKEPTTTPATSSSVSTAMSPIILFLPLTLALVWLDGAPKLCKQHIQTIFNGVTPTLSL